MKDTQTARSAAEPARNPPHPGLAEAWAKYPFDAEATRRYREQQRLRLRPRLAATLFGAASVLVVFWAGDWIVTAPDPPLASLVARGVAALLFLVLAFLVLAERGGRLVTPVIAAATVIAALTFVWLDSLLDDQRGLLMATLPLVSMCHVAIIPYFRAYPAPALVLLLTVNAYLFLDQSTTAVDLLFLNIYLLPTILLAGLLCLLISLQRRSAYGLEQELDLKASIDPLTGVANRRALEERIAQEEARRARGHFPMSLLLIDLDHFKRVNDRYGHQTGDLVLREVTARCRRELREIDLLARIGGEEFVVLLPQADLAAATGAAERLRACIADRPIAVKGIEIPVTISIGGTEYHPGESFDEAFLRADAAVYRAKEAGRNRVETA